IKYVNDALLRMFGFSRHEIENWDLSKLVKLINPEDLIELRQYRKKLRSGIDDVKPYFSYRVFTKSKKLKWIDQFSRSISFQGKPAELIMVVDITEKKKAEEELIKLNKLKSDLLRRVSHELKTPLVSVKGNINLLMDVYRNELEIDVLNVVRDMYEGCNRLEDLVKSLIESSRLKAKEIELNFQEDDLAFLIRFCVKELENLAHFRNQKISIHMQQEKMITFFEKEKIYEVLNNLISNAIKYTPQGGKITVTAKKQDNYYIVSIEDTGIGITKEEKGQIFKEFGKIERFGQGWDLDIEGSGLGLFLSKKIVKLHKGKIWVESEGRTKGSIFLFSLPIIKKH
ncbi:MAG: PAS domain S-box protein, partial [Candidatus Lokiarchaeota archaeon]|nr:PAS domain S-box protein [Candidatus Lokiarchaeota archaeon]